MSLYRTLLSALKELKYRTVMKATEYKYIQGVKKLSMGLS